MNFDTTYLVRCANKHATFQVPLVSPNGVETASEANCTCGEPWTIIARFVAHEFASGSLIGLPSEPRPTP